MVLSGSKVEHRDRDRFLQDLTASARAPLPMRRGDPQQIPKTRFLSSQPVDHHGLRRGSGFAYHAKRMKTDSTRSGRRWRSRRASFNRPSISGPRSFERGFEALRRSGRSASGFSTTLVRQTRWEFANRCVDFQVAKSKHPGPRRVAWESGGGGRGSFRSAQLGPAPLRQAAVRAGHGPVDEIGLLLCPSAGRTATSFSPPGYNGSWSVPPSLQTCRAGVQVRSYQT